MYFGTGLQKKADQLFSDKRFDDALTIYNQAQEVILRYAAHRSIRYNGAQRFIRVY